MSACRLKQQLSYRLRFWTMSIGRLTAHGDPQIFPLRTLKQRSWNEGARYTQLSGKLMSGLKWISPPLWFNCPLVALLLLGSSTFCSLPSRGSMFPPPRRQMEGSLLLCALVAWLQSKVRKRGGRKPKKWWASLKNHFLAKHEAVSCGETESKKGWLLNPRRSSELSLFFEDVLLPPLLPLSSLPPSVAESSHSGLWNICALHVDYKKRGEGAFIFAFLGG